jgi:hypothetical protein
VLLLSLHRVKQNGTLFIHLYIDIASAGIRTPDYPAYSPVLCSLGKGPNSERHSVVHRGGITKEFTTLHK